MMARTWAWCAGLLAVGMSVAAPAGVRAQECSDDADCPAGFECDLYPSAGASEPDCAPGMSCDRAPAPEPELRGECEPAELHCKTDSDCPSGATCELRRNDCGSASAPDSPGSDSGSDSDAAPIAGSGGAGGSGGASPEPKVPVEEECEQPSEGECVFTLTECDANSDCKGGDVCTAFGSEESCSQDTPVCVGNNCPEPEEQEPSCESRTISYCFPEAVDCSDGQACSGAARCVELPEDIEDEAPPSWNGASALCLPEVWALAFEERIEIEGGRGSSEAASDRANTSGGAKSSSDDDAAEDGGATEDDGCAVSDPGASGRGGAWLLLGAAALLLGYRRRAYRA